MSIRVAAEQAGEKRAVHGGGLLGPEGRRGSGGVSTHGELALQDRQIPAAIKRSFPPGSRRRRSWKTSQSLIPGIAGSPVCVRRGSHPELPGAGDRMRLGAACDFLVQRGARYVCGVDASADLVQQARERYRRPGLELRPGDARAAGARGRDLRPRAGGRGRGAGARDEALDELRRVLRREGHLRHRGPQRRSRGQAGASRTTSWRTGWRDASPKCA